MGFDTPTADWKAAGHDKVLAEARASAEEQARNGYDTRIVDQDREVAVELVLGCRLVPMPAKEKTARIRSNERPRPYATQWLSPAGWLPGRDFIDRDSAIEYARMQSEGHENAADMVVRVIDRGALAGRGRALKVVRKSAG